MCPNPYALSVTFDTTLSGTQLDNLVLNTQQDVASAHCSGCVGIAPIAGDLTAHVSSFSITDGSGFSVTQRIQRIMAVMLQLIATGTYFRGLFMRKVIPPAKRVSSIKL